MSPPVDSVIANGDGEAVSQLTVFVPTDAFDPSYRCSEDEDSPILLQNETQLTQEVDNNDILTPQAPKKARLSSQSVSNESSSITSQEDLLVANNSAPSPNDARAAPATCESNWNEHNNSKGVLLAMCVGLVPENPKFAVYAEDPNYMSRLQKATFKTSKPMYVHEVQRRHMLYFGADKKKHCKSFSVNQLVAYLVAHPITNPADVAFLKRQELAFRTSLDDAAKERAALSDLHNVDSWLGNAPWLRLYHVITATGILPAYMEMDQWEGRQGLDARNSDKHPPSFFELAAELYNDSSFVVTTAAYPHLHSDFNEQFKIRVSDPNIPVVTPDKIKKKLAEAKANLSKIVSDWEASGNGSGQRDVEQDKYGHVDEDTLFLNVGVDKDDGNEFMDGDNRACFLQNRRSHLLYMWELFDIYDLLGHTLNKLASNVSVDSEHVPKTVDKSKKKIAEKSEKDKLQENFVHTASKAAKAMETMAKRQVDSQIISFERHLILLQDKLDKLEDDGRSEESMEEVKEQIKRVKRRIDSLYGETEST